MSASSPSGMSIDQFATLLNATQEYFKPGQLAMTLNHKKYEVTNQIIPQYAQMGSGKQWETHIQLEDSPNGGHTGLFFAENQTQLFDTDYTLTSYYRHYKNSISYDMLQLDLNRGDRVQRYNYLKSQRMALHRKVADDIKEDFWSAPASSSDTTSPIGPFGWITMGDDNDTGSFSGGNPYYLDGNTYTKGGQSASTYSRLKSYYVDHNGVLDSTLLDKIADADLSTSFEVPIIPGQQAVGDVGNMSVVRYTSKNVIINIEKVARNYDDRVGYDLGKYRGETTYKGIPFRYNDIFDTASTYLYGTDPIVAIDWKVMYPVIVKGWKFKSQLKDNAFCDTAKDEFVHLVYVGCHSENPQLSGYMISQHS
jgi:hypothetical protein